MNRKGLMFFYITGVIILILLTGFEYVNTMKIKNFFSSNNSSEMHKIQTQDLNGDNAEFSILTDTTQEMQYADYWTRDDSNNILYSYAEIENYNNNNPVYVSYYSTSEARNYKLYMYDLPEEIQGEAVKALIASEYSLANDGDSSLVYIDGVLSDSVFWDRIQENQNYESIKEIVIPRYAISVKRSVAKAVPSDAFASKDPEEVYFNDFICAEIMPFDGVVILHESRDGEWFFILNGSFCGWVKKDSLAICKDRDEWLKVCKPENFIIVTGSEIVLDETAVTMSSSGMILPMGTKILLSEDHDQKINKRADFGCYRVDIPCRSDDGFLCFEKTLIPISKDIHVGFLPMTSNSVVEQAFKFLGRVYGYGGSLSSNDCSGFVRQVYSCYGFELPRNAKAIAERSDLGSLNCEKMTSEKKKSIFAQMKPGLLTYMDGHIMIYLGMENDMPYVISSCATYIEPNGEKDNIEEAYCIFVSSMDLKRTNGKTWLEDVSYILDKDIK